MNKKFLWALALPLGVTLAINTVAQAAEAAKIDRVTAQEAIAMVKKGVSYIKANGREKGFAEINNKQGQFQDRELYLVVIQLDGTMLAHGANDRMIGKNLIQLKDVDGKEMVREQVEQGKTKDSYWVDFKFTNPVTRKVEAKSMHCKRLDDAEGNAIVCGGIYKAL